jgi:hypothetical protein
VSTKEQSRLKLFSEIECGITVGWVEGGWGGLKVEGFSTSGALHQAASSEV